MMIYNLLRYILYIIIFSVSIFNRKFRLFFRKRLCRNFGNDLFEDNGNGAILIHMSSVGEFNLSRELIERLLQKNEKVVISVMTDTGKETAEKTYGNSKNVRIIYFPLDDYFLLLKIFRLYKIRKTIIIETEIWPNLYSVAAKKSELYIVNGRLTEKKMRLYLKMKRPIGKILDKAVKIMVQSEEDKERYIRLGIKKNKLKVYKNLKYSIRYDILTEKQKEKYFETCINKDRKIIVCGSTRQGEEKIWIEIFSEINVNSEYQLILVPRHLDRIQEIIDGTEEIYMKRKKEEQSETNNFEVGQNEAESPETEKIGSEKFKIRQVLSDKKNNNENRKPYSLFSENKRNDIIIVDKMGVLRDFYQLADFIFVGGTLTNIGGHSVLEPLYYGKMPIIGRYYENIEEIVKEAGKMNFIKIVKNKNEIIEYLKKSEIISTSEFFKQNNEIDKILKELYK